MTDLLMELIRPPWIELWRLLKPSDFDVAAARLFGNVPIKKPGETPKPYGADEYRKRLGIDVAKLCRGFYAEVGGTDAPTGPVTPATERLVIKPILAIRQTQRGNYQIHGLAATEGFYNRDKTKAWIKVDAYEKLLGDHFYQEIIDETERIKQAAAKHEPSQRDLKVVEVPHQQEFSPHEQKIIETILKKS